MESEEDPIKIDQIKGLREILESLSGSISQPLDSTRELKLVELKSKFRKRIRNYHKIMKVEGKIWRTKEDLDSAYKYFKMQVKSHHNSESFKVKGLGEAALQNMEYLIERAKQDLEVYFIRKPTPRTIENKEQIHTFCLKGKNSNTPKTLLKNLCKTTKVEVDDRKFAISI